MGKRKLLETVTNQKTIEIRRINAKCAEYPGLDPGTEKGHHWKSWRHSNKDRGLVNSNAQQ